MPAHRMLALARLALLALAVPGQAATPAAALLAAASPAAASSAAASPAAASSAAASPAPEPRESALRCLALAIVHEAGRESEPGQAAVAEVILNRVAHPAYPKSVCGVVFDGATRATGCQFSFTCDGSLRRAVTPERLLAARALAGTVLDGIAPRQVPGATHYHASYVAPRWAPGLVRLAGIGQHVFYRLPGVPPVTPPRQPQQPPSPSPPPGFAPWGLASSG